MVDWVKECEDRIFRAALRYGNLASTHEGLGVAAEEWDELRDAIHSNDLEQIRKECFDVAAVLIRLACSCENSEFKKRSVK